MDLEVEGVETRSRFSPVADYVLESQYGAYWRDWLQRSRIEINAMTTPQLIAWLDRKMAKRHGVKVIPPVSVLEARNAKEDRRVPARRHHEVLPARRAHRGPRARGHAGSAAARRRSAGVASFVRS